MAKTSKKTEEEMLQETFAQFQTQATTEDAATESGDAVKGATKSGNKNNAILVVSCVAAVGIIGYIFFLKPMLSDSARPVQVTQNAPMVSAAPEVPKAPLVAPVVEAPVVATPVAPALDPIAQLQAQQAQAQASTMPAPVPVQDPAAQIKNPEIDKFFDKNQNQLPGAVNNQVAEPVKPVVPPVVPVIAEAPVVPPQLDSSVKPISPVTNAPVVNDIVPVQSNVAVNNLDAQQTNVITELQNRFESKNNEFKDLLSGVDSRVTNLEGKLINHDERITRLESFHEGQKSKAKTVEKKTETKPEKTGESDVKAVEVSEKTKAVVKKVRPAVKHKEASGQDENVLFGSVNQKSGKQKETNSKAVEKAEKPNYQDYPIHSIYGGRFWLKNNDGSLSTYAAGDKLPSGEIVKEVNDEEFSIKTNLRTIVKK